MNDTTTRRGPRYWVVGIIVFLTVVLAGLAVPGASALWSQQANTTVSVTTGHWKNTQPGWTVPMTIDFTGARYSEFLGGEHTATLVITPHAQDMLVPGLGYRVEVIPATWGASATVGASTVSNGQIKVPISTQRRALQLTADFTVRVTPVLNGSQGVTAERELRSSWQTLSWRN